MKFLLIVLFLFSFSQAKKDFFYSFIDSSGNQISEKSKLEISDGFEVINHAKQLSREGKIDEAYAQIEAFKAQNKIRVLESDLIILYSELCLKKKSKRLIIQAANELEEAINRSKIHEQDLAKAYMILVELKLNLNKVDDATYFANIIIKNFDNPLTKAYGKIYLAKISKYQKEYDKAIATLYKILTETTNLEVATIVADELFDVYLLNGQKEKAYELITKVLDRNIEYYISDSYLAIEKVNKLVKAGMPQFAAKILEELLKQAHVKSAIEDFKFKLANVYMLMYDRTPKYLLKAKELYKDIINENPNGPHLKDSKIFLDEILMREKKIEPAVLANKYQDSESMQQKVLLQEMLNNWAAKNYEIIFKSRRVYNKISDSIAKRFGYESINELFDEISVDMIKTYLKEGKCALLEETFNEARAETFELLIKDESVKDNFFECLIETPSKRAYLLLNNAFNDDRDPYLYLFLERMAISLGNYEDAENFSSKVAMVDNKEVLSKEFLYKFLILLNKNEPIAFNRFFDYARKHPSYIDDNVNNPMIIDFYYNYYLYLTKRGLNSDAKDILEKLNTKQHELKAFVYSPSVELDLAKELQSSGENQRAIDTLNEGLKNARRVKPNDMAQAYYQMIKLYEAQGNSEKQNEFIDKCKKIENTQDSFYKKMCDEM